jgi:hypothetical protein
LRSCYDLVCESNDWSGFEVKVFFALLVVSLLSFDVVACGGSGSGSASRAHSSAVASAGGATVPASTSASQTSTTGEGPGASERELDETVGVAAGEADRLAVSSIVKRYYAAVAADNGVQACSLLYQPLAKSFDEDYSEVSGPRELRGKSCIEITSKLFRHRRGQPTSDVSGIEVTGVRVVNDIMAVALLHSPTMPVGDISLQREGGIWRVDEMLGNTLH